MTLAFEKAGKFLNISFFTKAHAEIPPFPAEKGGAEGGFKKAISLNVRKDFSVDRFSLRGRANPESCGENLFAAAINRQCFGLPAQLLIAGHESLIKLFRQIIHFQPLLETLYSFFPFPPFLAEESYPFNPPEELAPQPLTLRHDPGFFDLLTQERALVLLYGFLSEFDGAILLTFFPSDLGLLQDALECPGINTAIGSI